MSNSPPIPVDLHCSQLLTALDQLESLLSKAIDFNAAQPSDLTNAMVLVLTRAKENFHPFVSSLQASSKCLERYLGVLDKYLTEGTRLIDSWTQNKRQEQDLLILEAKLEVMVEFLEPATKVDSDDLFSQDDTHPRWQRLRQATELIYADDDALMHRSLDSFSEKVAIGNALLTTGLSYEDPLMRKLIVGAGACYYFLFRDAAVQQAKLNYTKPDIVAAKALWNLVDSKLVSSVYQSLIIPIRSNSMIYIPRTAPFVLEPVSQPNPDPVNYTGRHYVEQLREEPIHSLVGFSESMDPGKHRVPVRVLSPYDLQMLTFTPRTHCFSLCCEDMVTAGRESRQIIIHIHGGGFIAMSSNSHQNYTRRWAQDTNTPVVSIDYRLAPENRFPDALDDCWQVYMWVVHHAKKYLGITPERIVLAGDSAGGNLALGVTLRCVKSLERVPDGLLLTYPCVSLDRKCFSPSLTLCLEDMLVPYSFLKLCAESYLRPGDDPATDPFLSPLKTEKRDLERFPPVRMLLCGNDPLQDDCFRLAERMVEAGVSVRIAKFEGMSHGALNLDLALGVSEARMLVNKGTEYLKELLEM